MDLADFGFTSFGKKGGKQPYRPPPKPQQKRDLSSSDEEHPPKKIKSQSQTPQIETVNPNFQSPMFDRKPVPAGFLPVTVANFSPKHHLTLKDHSKPVSALALDKSGARIAIGGLDYDVAMYDFAGMTTALNTFR